MGRISRRRFLQLAAAGTGAAVAAKVGAAPAGKLLVPYVTAPEGQRAGVWTLYATTCRECPAGCGLHMRVIDGRPVKAEGNPNHPVNRGGLCARGQSCVQGLYDPDRVRGVLHTNGTKPRINTNGHEYGGQSGLAPDGWEAAIASIGARLGQGKGRVAIISDMQTGALRSLMSGFLGAFGSDRLLFYESFNYEPLRAANEILFGRGTIPDIRMDQCDFILSLSADFLETWLSPVQYAAQFAAARELSDGRRSRFVYAGPRLSMTAANADVFVQTPAGSEAAVALAMLDVMVAQGWVRSDREALRAVLQKWKKPALPPGISETAIRDMARRFFEAKASLALAGPMGAIGPSALHNALAAGLLNHAAGRIGQTVDFSRSHALSQAATREELRRFLAALSPEDVLIIHSTNPAYSFPEAQSALERAGMVVYLGTHLDETAESATWVLPIDSPLESWGDYEPWPGTKGLLQPMLRRLHDTRTGGDVLLALARAGGASWAPAESFQASLRKEWEAAHSASKDAWREALRSGGNWTDPPPVAVQWNAEATARAVADSNVPPTPSGPASAGAALWLWPSVMTGDGRHANRGWLQEAPDPTSSVVWGSYVDIHPAKARALQVSDGDVVELKTQAGVIEAPARITADVHEDAVALAFGQGHTALGQNAAGCGTNAFRLLEDGAADSPFGEVAIHKTGRASSNVRAYLTQDQHGVEAMQWVPLSVLRRRSAGAANAITIPLPEGYDKQKDLYGGMVYKEHRWAMVVDLNRCTGCGACAVACYAENNVPVVGKEQFQRGKPQPWLQIVPYRHPDEPQRLGFLPMLCQHCDAAPCEPVCPVFASVHNEEGLNAQVYNRCIGTRYCSNNCPYKVRRFNWMNVEWREPLNLQLNPDVSVRSRGVMEKCSFCIQRIREAESRARNEKRPLKDGEFTTACAQSCPTRAILFGDLLDLNSKVSRLTGERPGLAGDPRRYQVLRELNTRPAVVYLRRVRDDDST